jgi:hypothetical protein
VTFSWTADSQADLNDTFTTYELDLGILGLSYSKGYNAAGDYEGEVSVGPTVGIGFAKYETDTFGTGAQYSPPTSLWGEKDLPVGDGTDSLNLNSLK